MEIRTNGARVVNGASITGDPAIGIFADDVYLLNISGGDIRTSGTAAILISGARNRIVNESGATIAAASQQTAILGSAFDDAVENAGTIEGRVVLGGGADSLTLRGGNLTAQVDLGDGNDALFASGGSVQGHVEFGAGDDTMRVTNESGFYGGTMFGGSGFDTLILDVLPYYAVQTAGFERLQVTITQHQTWNTQIVGDFTEILLTGTGQFPGYANLLQTVLPNAAIFLDGASVTLNYATIVKSVTGSAKSETIEFATAQAYNDPSGTVTDFVDLGGGDDQVRFWTFDGRAAAPNAPVRGGAGHDTINFSSGAEAQLNLSQFSGFETLTLGSGFSAPGRLTVSHIPDVSTIRIFGNYSGDAPLTAILKSSDRPEALVQTVGNAKIEIAADAKLGGVADFAADPANPFMASAQNIELFGTLAGGVDLRGENDVLRNGGSIGGAVLLGDGADRYIETTSEASVAGSVDGGAGDDRFELILPGPGSATRFDGGSGADLIAFTGAVAIDLVTGQASGSGAAFTTINFEHVLGSASNDILLGTSGANTLIGSDGDDQIDGRAGNDLLFGDSGADQVTGGAGQDSISGGLGDDDLRGNDGDDSLEGGAGNDLIAGGAGADIALFSGQRSAYDFMFTVGGLKVTGPDGADLLTDVERLSFAGGVVTANLLDQSPDLAIGTFGTSGAAGGWASNDTYPRTAADVNGDGRADLVGFGSAGVYVAQADLAGGFGPVRLAYGGFGASDPAGGWFSQDRYARTLADIDGDGRADLVGFGANGVYAALSDGQDGFGSTFLAKNSFGFAAAGGGWSSGGLYPRMLGDVNGDGLADLVGFGSAGVYVALAAGGGRFGDVQLAYRGFGAADAAGGWSSNDRYPRMLADLDGDGRADLAGFGANGVFAAFSDGAGSFGPVQQVSNGFGSADAAGGWSSNDRFPRLFADVNGDGADDLLGFGANGTFVALNSGQGSFGAAKLEISSFGYADQAGGWRDQGGYLRMAADISGDGLADIIGFGGAGVYTAYAESFTFG
jgi:hypothetical protein